MYSKVGGVAWTIRATVFRTVKAVLPDSGPCPTMPGSLLAGADSRKAVLRTWIGRCALVKEMELP